MIFPLSMCAEAVRPLPAPSVLRSRSIAPRILGRVPGGQPGGGATAATGEPHAVVPVLAVQSLFAGRSPAGCRICERLGVPDHMHDTIFVDPFLAEKVDERRILDADGAPDERCVERVGARYARPCHHAQQAYAVVPHWPCWVPVPEASRTGLGA